ncbi:MAG: hypothetical protein J6A69_09575 [Clostridia bacterium]|nr:hypothetical protein [Clostridia bacterium]
MKAIGIDIGTTSICGIVCDAKSGEILKVINKDSNAFLKGSADWEKIQSVDKIISCAREILDSLIDEDVKVIGVTGQMHGIVYTDKNGEAVSPLYTWQDGRGNLLYKDTTYAKYLNSFTGYGNVTDFYNRENNIRPENAEYFCTIHDYFVMTLCNLYKPLIHISDLASFGAENKSGADVTDGYTIAGKYKNIPVSVAIGDNQASVFSTLADENDVLINVGTGSQVSVISSNKVTGEDIEVRPYFENKYLIVGAALCGGRAYSLLKDFYSEIFEYTGAFDDNAVYSIMNKMLQKTDNLTLEVDTRFAGTRKNPQLCGSISGITTENFNPSALTYGMLSGMANELFEMYKQMKSEKLGIVGSGNGVRKNSDFIKILEEKFGGELKIPVHTEEASFGAALYGLIACGVYNNAADVQKLIEYIK